MNKNLIKILLAIRSIEGNYGGCFAELLYTDKVICINVGCSCCPCALENFDDTSDKDYAYKLIRIPVSEI